VHPRLSESRLSNTLIIRTVVMTVLLEYFAKSVCCIRVVQRSSVYKSMGFIYPNKFTYLNTFLKSLVQRSLVNRGCTVPLLQVFFLLIFFSAHESSWPMNHLIAEAAAITDRVYFLENSAGGGQNLLLINECTNHMTHAPSRGMKFICCEIKFGSNFVKNL